jgi:hypothetical protein
MRQSLNCAIWIWICFLAAYLLRRYRDLDTLQPKCSSEQKRKGGEMQMPHTPRAVSETAFSAGTVAGEGWLS